MLFLFVGMTLMALLYGYLALRLGRMFELSDAARRAGRLLFVLLWLCSPLPVLLRVAGIENGGSDLLAWILYLCLGLASLLLALLLPVDGMRWLWAKARLLFFARPVNRHRRNFMRRSVDWSVVGAGVALGGVGMRTALALPLVREVTVPLGRTPLPLRDLRIAQFTDLHIGPTIGRDYVEGVVGIIGQLQPEIVVITGDLVDGSVEHLRDSVAPLRQLAPRYGKYFVTGNHEYYAGAEAWIDHLRSLGFVVLLNEHRLIEHAGARLLLAGVTDFRAHDYLPAHRSDAAQAVAGAAAADLRILLAHQPKSVLAAAEAGFDLQLSGHTHGGQYLPWGAMAAVANPYVRGLHRHNERTWIYVSPGTGFWGPPLRLGTEPEITLIRLR